MQQVEAGNRKIVAIDRRCFKGSGTRFLNGDTLLARITPSFENGKTAYVDFLEDLEVAHGSTEFIVLAARESVADGLFIYYLARSPQLRESPHEWYRPPESPRFGTQGVCLSLFPV